MNITVTLTASPELLSAIQTLTAALAGAGQTTKKPVKQQVAAAPANEQPVQSPAPVSEAVKNEPAASNDEEITIEEVRALVQEKSKAGKREVIKAILTEFGVPRVTDLGKDQYQPFVTKVKAA